MSFLREDNIKSGGNDVITLIFLATIPVQTKVLQQDFLSWFIWKVFIHQSRIRRYSKFLAGKRFWSRQIGPKLLKEKNDRSYAMLIRIFSETFSCMPLVFVFFNSPKYIWPNSLKILVNCVFSLTRIFLQPFSILNTVYVLYIHGFFLSVQFHF